MFMPRIETERYIFSQRYSTRMGSAPTSIGSNRLMIEAGASGNAKTVHSPIPSSPVSVRRRTKVAVCATKVSTLSIFMSEPLIQSGVDEMGGPATLGRLDDFNDGVNGSVRLEVAEAAVAIGSESRSALNRPEATRLHLGARRGDVRNVHPDVMQPFAVSFQMLGEQAVARKRLHEFELRAVFPGQCMPEAELTRRAAEMGVAEEVLGQRPSGPGTDPELLP